MSIKRLLYSLILYLIFPLVILRLYWRSRANPAYRQRISERLGLVKLECNKPCIWLHAVSVGETIATKPLIDALITQYPEHRILVTTTTPTGSERVKALFSERVAHVYFPYDLPEIIYRFLKRIKPQILIIVETEIWPNLYAVCHKRNIPLMIVNARLSPRSTQSYLKIRPLVAETLANVNLIAVRSKADSDSFKQLGALEDQIKIEGNIKFDLQLDKQQIKLGIQRRIEWGVNRPVWVAASTHAGEDVAILEIYITLLIQFPELILVLVPRHPERFDEVYQLCRKLEEQGIHTLRHSQLDKYTNQTTNIILGDSMGEMQSWFACADVVFIGGSLVKTGGHNPLEATAQGVPVVSGKYMFNFEDITTELTQADLLYICDTVEEIKKRISTLLFTSRSVSNDFSEKAKKIMQQHKGVTARLMKHISNCLDKK